MTQLKELISQLDAVYAQYDKAETNIDYECLDEEIASLMQSLGHAAYDQRHIFKQKQD